MLSVFAERRLRAGHPAGVDRLLEDIANPPVQTLGAMPIDEFFPKRDRLSLATALNTLLASPTLSTPLGALRWRLLSSKAVLQARRHPWRPPRSTTSAR